MMSILSPMEVRLLEGDPRSYPGSYRMIQYENELQSRQLKANSVNAKVQPIHFADVLDQMKAGTFALSTNRETGVVGFWAQSNSVENGVFVVVVKYVTLGGPEIEVFNFGLYEDANTMGVSIGLGYKDNLTGASDFRWVQTITTSDPLYAVYGSPYVDPLPNSPGYDGPKPFYYPENMTKKSQNQVVGGKVYSAVFSDEPKRPKETNGRIITWAAELSLVGKRGNYYVPLITITYGFTISNGKGQAIAPSVVAKPSQFHLQSFMNKIW